MRFRRPDGQRPYRSGPGGRKAADKSRQPLATSDDERDDPDRELLKLLAVSRRICVTEDANAGKTVFTHRLQAFLASPIPWQAFFDGKPRLPVRWEEARGNHWPRDVRHDLEEAVAPYCPGRECRSRSMALLRRAARLRTGMLLWLRVR